MVVDVELFNSLSRCSNQRVLCKCDECGAEKMLKKHSITNLKNGTHELCYLCNLKKLKKFTKGDKWTPEIREKFLKSRRKRVFTEQEKEAYRLRMTGENNFKWIKDRVEKESRRKACKSYYSILAKILINTSNKKSESSHKIMGYTPTELKNNLESKFQDGMRWGNKGEWHIDHIKPISAFLKEGVTAPNIINALDNLQPLWGIDNLKKSNKY